MAKIKLLSNIYIVLAIAILVRLYFVFSSHYISPDGTQYTMLGYNLVHNFQYQSNGGYFPDIIQPPLYPFMAGIFTLLFSPEFAGKLISLIFGILLVYAVYRFTLFIKPTGNTAILATWIAALHPALISVSSQAATESLYIFLLFSGFAAGWIYLNIKETKLIIIVSTIWLLSFLTRPEGVVFFVLYLLLLTVLLLWRKIKIIHYLAYLVPFIIGVVIYGNLVQSELGYFTISPKIKFIRGHGKMKNYYLRMDAESNVTTTKKLESHRFKYSLAPDSSSLAADALLYKDPKMVEIIQSSSANTRQQSFLITNVILLLKKNVSDLFRRMMYGTVLPISVVFLILIGLLYPLLSKRHLKFLLYTVLISIGIFSFMLSHFEERFLYGLLPITAIPAGRGFSQVIKMSSDWAGNNNILKTKMMALFLALFIIFNIPYYNHELKKQAEKDYYFNAGQFLTESVPENSKICAVHPQSIFFAGLLYKPLPYASAKGLFIFLNRNNIRYFLLEEKDKYTRPAFNENQSEMNKYFQLHKTFVSGNHKFYLYRVK